MKTENISRARAKAQRLYFIDKKSIKEIAVQMELTSQTVGRYLRSSPAYADEKINRQAQKRAGRKKYQRNWMADKRNTGRLGDEITEKAILRRQHEIDVRTLSHDKF